MITKDELLRKVEEKLYASRGDELNLKKMFDEKISKADIVAQLKLFVKLANVIKRSEALKEDAFSRAEMAFVAGDVVNIIKRLEKHGV